MIIAASLATILDASDGDNAMDARIAKLGPVEACETFERNAITRGREDLAIDARKRALEIRAHQYGTLSEPELECLKAIYPYEQVLTARHGKKTSASRTWQMIKRHGIIGAVDRAVSRREATTGYSALIDMGLKNLRLKLS
jgi:hypothetical protein